ncbi:S-layer protein, partial [Bacillus pseudomycoides]
SATSWSYLKDGKYVTGSFTYKGKQFEINKYGDMEKGWITLRSAIKRIYPKPEAKFLLESKSVKDGDILEVISKQGLWYQVKYQGGIGYVRVLESVVIGESPVRSWDVAKEAGTLSHFMMTEYHKDPEKYFPLNVLKKFEKHWDSDANVLANGLKFIGEIKSELYLDNKKGWVQEEGKWTYYRKDGQRVTDLQTIDGKRYYFDSNGIMQIGWLNKNGSKYYFNSSGVMQTGVQYIDGKVCYFNDLGLLSNGYHTVEGKPYYFDASQGPKSGWMKKEYEWYLLYPTGALKTGDFTYKDKKFSFNQEGEMVKGWIILESLVKKVYPEPDLKRVLRAKHVEKGEVIEVTGKTGQWYEVKYQGEKGYVRIHDAVIFDQETKSPLTLLDGKVKIFEGVLNYLKSDETLVNDTFKALEKIEYNTMDSIEIYNSITQDIDNRIQSIKEEREILREFIAKAKEAEKKLIKDAKDLANQTISYTIDLVGGAIDITQYTVHSVIVAAEMNEQILTQIYEGESKRIQELQSAMKDIQISQELLTEMYIKYKYGIEYQQMLQEAKNIKFQAEKFQHSLDELNKKMVPLTKETKEFMNQLHQHYGEIEKKAPGIFSDINDGLDSANNLMNTANKYASYKIDIPAAARNVGNIDLTNSLRDFGVRQDKLDAYLAQQKADNQQMDFILSITPGIGTAKEVSQLALGKNINTGEKYKASDYAWGTLA